MKNEQPPFSGFVDPIGRWMSYTKLPQSLSELYRAIQKNTYGKDINIGRPDGYPEINRATVRRHLRKLVKQHVLVRLPKVRRWPNVTLYSIHSNMLYYYSDYLLTLLTRNKLSITEKDRLLSSIL